MGNPIQYRNTDNPSQIQGWVSHNKGGFHKTASVCRGGANHNAFIVMVRPPGRTGGGVNENVSLGGSGYMEQKILGLLKN